LPYKEEEETVWLELFFILSRKLHEAVEFSKYIVLMLDFDTEIVDNAVMSMLKTIINVFTGNRVDPELVDAYRSAIPSNIQMTISQNGDTYMAIITGLEHNPLPKEVCLVTEATTEAKLVDMVNDLIFSYKRIPENYRPFYRNILKPEGSINTGAALSLVKSA
jgi:hypothetical protein